jgi:hypothetical protein
MSDAGAEALREARERGADDETTALMVYDAMSSVYALIMAQDANKTRH